MEVNYEWVCNPVDTTPKEVLERDLKDFSKAFNIFIEKYDHIIENKEKQKFMHEIRHYFPGIIKLRTAKKGGKEYYIDDLKKAKKIIEIGLETKKFYKAHNFMRAKLGRCSL